jgi:glycerophosphoryl diester phosphodiesterase
MKIIAHRGASAYAPENTFAAFDFALRIGSKDIELDVQLTCDGELAVIHDVTLNRTSNGEGIVEQKTRSYLESLDAGSWFDSRFSEERIPFLENVFKRYFRRAHLHVEIKGKGTGITKKVLQSIRNCSMDGQVSLTSFQPERLAESLDLAPELPRIWLVAELSEELLTIAQELKLSEISLKAAALNPDTVAAIRSRGFGVRAWSVQNEQLMRQMATLGIEAMTVNFPDLLQPNAASAIPTRMQPPPAI